MRPPPPSCCRLTLWPAGSDLFRPFLPIPRRRRARRCCPTLSSRSARRRLASGRSRCRRHGCETPCTPRCCSALAAACRAGGRVAGAADCGGRDVPRDENREAHEEELEANDHQGEEEPRRSGPTGLNAPSAVRQQGLTPAPDAQATFVGEGFTRKPPKYERFIRPTASARECPPPPMPPAAQPRRAGFGPGPACLQPC